jgi:hypothetical protein
MTNYSRFKRPPKPYTNGIHPIWRGIGCLLILIMPVLAYKSAIELVNFGLSNYWPIPQYLLGFIEFPVWIWKIRFLSTLAQPIANFRNLGAILVSTLVILVFLSGVFSLLYAIMYRFIGPPRLTPLDAPPIKGRKVKKSR